MSSFSRSLWSISILALTAIGTQSALAAVSISNIHVTVNSSSEVTITYATTTKTATTIKYGLTSSYGKKFSNSTKTKQHTAAIKGLASGKTYHYQIVSGSSVSPDETFVTASSTKPSPSPSPSPSVTATPSPSPSASATPSPAPRPSPSIVPNPVPSATVTPQIAAAFVDSIGVNIHLSYYGTVYTNDFNQLKTLAVALGVHHFRDGLVPGQSTPCQNATSLAQATGGTLDLIVDTTQVATDIQSYVDCIGPSYVDALEGPNELDISDSNFVQDDITAMGVINQAISTYPELQNINVVAPSMGAAAQDYVSLAQALVGSPLPFTIGNGHYYFSTFNPGTSGWGGSFTVNGQSYVYGSLGYNFAYSEALSGSDPIYMTETGYQSNQVGTALQANYVPRTLMLEFAAAPAGSREYVYELADDGASDGSYALIDSSANIKPAYTSLQNLLSALSDPAGGNGNSVSKTPVHFAMTGNTSNVQSMIYRKSTGEIDVVVWIETDEVNNGVPAPQSVTLQVERAIQNVSVTDTPQVIVFPQ